MSLCLVASRRGAVRLGSSQQSKRYLSAHARSPAAAQFHERHPLSTRLLASATACSQPRSTHSSSHLLSSTPLQQRSFGTGKPAVPIHETPHYMDYDTLVDMHLVTRQGFGDRPLFGTKVDGKYKWITYRDFGKKVDACRNALASIGISQGDTVACISKNREEWAVCAYATYTLGAIFVPMYEEQLLKDWEYIIADAGAKALLVSTKEVYQKTFHFAQVLGSLRTVHCFEAPPGDPSSFADFVGASHTAVPAYLPRPDCLATLIYTSGTTGKPKGVELSHGNLISNIVGLRAVLPEDLISCHDCSLSFLPWAHCYGQTAELHAFMAHGAALGIAESVDKLLVNLGEVKPTVLFSVPVLFKKVYDGIHAKVNGASAAKQYMFKKAMQVSHRRRLHLDKGEEVGSLTAAQHKFFDQLVLSKIRDTFGGNLKVSFVGGAATPLEVLSFFENIGVQICEGYGLTETSPLVSINTPERKNRRLGTTGRALGGVTITIVDDGKDVGPDKEGEVCVSGPNVMRGYHNSPEATAEVFFELNGKKYFRTGDLGKLEEGKFLKITGRLKEQYKLENGKYVVPGPIEAALTSSKFITQALLFGTDKPYNVALLVPDWALLEEWASQKTDLLPAQRADKQQLAHTTAVRNLIEGEVQKSLAGMKKYEIPRKWELLEEGFTKERGMMTPKMSVKRHIVMKEYKETIESLYADPVTQAVRQEMKASP